TATATTAIYTLSLHDALPIWNDRSAPVLSPGRPRRRPRRLLRHRSRRRVTAAGAPLTEPLPQHLAALRPCPGIPLRPAARTTERSEEHTSELQSRENLVCRLL